MNGQSQAAENFVKRIFTFLDETDSQQLAPLVQWFQPAGCKIIVNASAFAQAAGFLETWQRCVVQTQHVVTAVDFHVIPGTGSAVCSVNGKVRFDESGRDKAGQDAAVPAAAGTGATPAAPVGKHRPLWGPYFGLSLQLVVDERALGGDFNGVISSFNYTMVYRPEDSLMAV
ncbi:LAQU0S01e01860g1_1 [Lachancea quebecensis]|uniref:LAQU0S01e01860g1_1 n=1 Tax=Lachancea quebecensis TaxID=1654605 RepID=A0A0P1KKZ0_9SACH|nr:LAQU0S01e01860g1_1 [Lachancea quebecensis]